MSAWNPSDKSAGITLSSTNHVASGASGNNSVRGVTSHNTGKWYIEYPVISFGGAGAGLLGLADSTQGLGTTTLNNCAGVQASSGSLKNGWVGTTVVTGGAVDGHIISVAVDLDANRLWVRVDGGSWVGDGVSAGDPVAGTHGTVISARTSALFPFVFLQNVGTTPDATINTGDSAFSETAPTGYTAWDSPPPPPILRRPLVIF